MFIVFTTDSSCEKSSSDLFLNKIQTVLTYGWHPEFWRYLLSSSELRDMMMDQGEGVLVGISPREDGKRPHSNSHLPSVLVASGPLKI